MNSFLSEHAWPAGIVALLVVSMATSLSVVFWASSDGGAQVVENYYQRAVAWDSTAATTGRLAGIGWHADAAWQEETLVVTIRDGATRRQAVEALEVAGYRPNRTTPVRVWRPEPAGDGRYVAHTGALNPGLWDFVVRGVVAEGPFETKIRHTIPNP